MLSVFEFLGVKTLVSTLDFQNADLILQYISSHTFLLLLTYSPRPLIQHSSIFFCPIVYSYVPSLLVLLFLVRLPKELAPGTALLSASKKNFLVGADSSVRTTLMVAPVAATVSGGVWAVSPVQLIVWDNSQIFFSKLQR